MKTIGLLLAITAISQANLSAQGADPARWERQARNVTITRDDWGIAHVRGRSDADAVFGMVYVQAEDDFNRIEVNFLTNLGRLAEAEGETQIWQDLRQRLFINQDTLRALYGRSPAWLKRLMDAWADGLNFYLHTHPDTHPRVLTRFEPWMALSFSEGSIGGDISRVNLNLLRRFYDTPAAPAGTDGNDDDEALDLFPEPQGSNGMAVAPANTANGRALLLINPHTSFFFRSELQMTSDEGLNAYGAVTWGQFFIYQGFNERVGWMHTSSGVDNIDEYLETVSQRDGRWFYRHGTADRPLATETITVRYRGATGMSERSFTVYRSHHGPIVRKPAEARTPVQWVSVAMMNDPLNALIQSYARTKARSYREYRAGFERHTNSSNNTLFATADGDIAYFHSNFIPRRDTSFDWTRPVDGSNPATDWRGVISFDSTPNVINPASGWVYNSNDGPWWSAGPGSSPRKADFPVYVETGGWSARGRHAVRVLENRRDLDIPGLVGAAFDSYLPWFETTIPALLRAWDQAADSSALKARLREQIDALRGWDFRWAASSVPTSLAVFWGEAVQRRAMADTSRGTTGVEEFVATRANGTMLLQALAAASDTIAAGFGTWRTAWGDINRFQRLTSDMVQPFNDAGPSIPVGFTSATWGSLASFGARAYPGTRKWYGTSGNSFVAVVEFGRDSVRAVAVTAGGESGNPASPHFNDQAERYATGNLRPVYFYRAQLAGHTEREYHPGH